VTAPASRPGPIFRAVGAAVRLTGRMNRPGRRPPVAAVPRALRLTVAEVHREATDVVSLRLTAPDGAGLPPWHPGAHLDLELPSGRVRQYSLCGDPADTGGYRIAVRRIPDGDGGSREVHTLRPGASVTVRGPRPAFPLVRAPRYLFLAGGIGITPILPMVCAVAATGADWRLVHTGRDRASMPFAGELARLDPARVVIRPDDEHGGPPDGTELLRHAPGEHSTGYLCGPAPMLAAARRAWAGLPAGRLDALHVERFGAPPVLGGRPFTVELARTGATLAVPADRTVLDAVRATVPGVAFSCRQGFCGTCRTRVLAGPVEHRDRALTGAERASDMAICVSRAAGDRLVLDL
jgi:ferredoxin-NADP reductase